MYYLLRKITTLVEKQSSGGILQNFERFTGETPVQNLFFNKVQAEGF